MLSPSVSVISTTGTTEGDTVTLQCEDGLFPVIPVLITCNSAGVWSPDPAELVCTSNSPQGELNSRVHGSSGSSQNYILYLANYTIHAF